MLTTARDLRRHLIRWENEWYYAKHNGHVARMQELDWYIRLLRVRLARAEEQEAA